MKPKTKPVFVMLASLWLVPVSVPAAQRPAESSIGYLKTKVDPGRAGVFIDGRYMGPAGNFGVGRKYAVAAGEHEVRFTEPRYEDVITRVTIQPGKTTKLAHTMKSLPLAKPPFGRLRTTDFDKFSAVYVNEKYYGHADEFSNFAQGLLLNPGKYAVKIVPASGALHQEEVAIEADRVTIIKRK